jgi:exportin-2 (importin alpha re-exporter)
MFHRLWAQVLTNFVITQTPKMTPKDRKVAVVGVTRMLTESALVLREPSVQAWSVLFWRLLPVASSFFHVVLPSFFLD